MAATSRFIDVSSYQGAQDWKALAHGGLTGAQVKASEGEHTRDARYRAHMDGILSVASLLPQAYHYGWPTQDPHAEADNYLFVVSGDADRHPGFVHWLDLERRTDGMNYAGRTSGQIRAWAEAWIDRVKAAHPHQRVGCYTSGDDIKSGRYPANSDALWYPAYPAGAMSYTQAEQRSRPAPGVQPLMWQFTSTPLDRSICYLTPTALRAWTGATTTVREDAMPEPKDLWAYKNANADAAAVKAGKGHIPDAYGYLVQTNAAVKTLAAQVAGQNAAITALAKQLGTGKDVQTIVAAVKDAIATATVHVDVDVTGATDDAPAAPAAKS
jgi:GH25 family lysozyme M1 (1,4-beta-N-acetylmuramidase)